VSVRPILGATEGPGVERARSILAPILAVRGAAAQTPARPQNVGSQRLLDLATRARFTTSACGPPRRRDRSGRQHDGAGGHGREVAESLLDYYDAGATTVLIRGFDPLQDAIDFERDRFRSSAPGSSAAGARACPPARGHVTSSSLSRALTVVRIGADAFMDGQAGLRGKGKSAVK